VDNVDGSATIRLHELCIRSDGQQWVVGRVETGEFVAVPTVGARIIALLREGHDVDRCKRQLQQEGFGEVDVADFAASLVELGFVCAIDDHEVESAPPVRASLPWLRPSHVRWAQSRLIRAAVIAFIAAGAVVAALRPALLPAPRALLWSASGSAVLLGQVALSWALIFLHELAHLVTARAAGVPGRIRLSTRLQFLVAQTDVTGVWAADRPTRMTVYLAGMALDASLASAAVLTLAATATHAAIHRMAAVLLLTELLFLAPQLLVFMRTDLYFVLQDLTGCRNLYADGSAYLRYLATWVMRRTDITDPSRNLPHRERRAVRVYTLLLVIGTTVCLGLAVGVSLPVALGLIGRAVATVATGVGGARAVDALVVIFVLGGFQLVWCWAWWHRHGARVRRWARIAATASRARRSSSSGARRRASDCRRHIRSPSK
jgi:hypothetical protein